MYMYDIHMHIIPGVDDGSWDMEMSRRLLFMAYEQGIRKNPCNTSQQCVSR